MEERGSCEVRVQDQQDVLCLNKINIDSVLGAGYETALYLVIYYFTHGAAGDMISMSHNT
jgi:hypothetical protein